MACFQDWMFGRAEGPFGQWACLLLYTSFDGDGGAAMGLVGVRILLQHLASSQGPLSGADVVEIF